MDIRGKYMDLAKAFRLDTSPKKVQLAMLFIMGGALLRIALAKYPNIEPVIALSMLAGIILGGLWAFIVPLGIMVISDWAINVLYYETTYGWSNLLGISLFTWSGMIAIGLISTRFRPMFLFKWKKFAVFTGVGIVLTILFDLWTLVGMYIFFPQSVAVILYGQVSFTIYHIMSTLIFVPLFGTIYIYVREYGLPTIEKMRTETEEPEKE